MILRSYPSSCSFWVVQAPLSSPPKRSFARVTYRLMNDFLKSTADLFNHQASSSIFLKNPPAILNYHPLKTHHFPRECHLLIAALISPQWRQWPPGVVFRHKWRHGQKNWGKQQATKKMLAVVDYSRKHRSKSLWESIFCFMCFDDFLICRDTEDTGKKSILKVCPKKLSRKLLL